MKVEWDRGNQQFIYIYEAEEAKALFEKKLHGIFHPEQIGGWRWQNLNIKRNFFNNPDWTVVVLPGPVDQCVEVSEAVFDELPENWENEVAEEIYDEIYDNCMYRNITNDALQPLFEMLVEDSCQTIITVPEYYGDSWIGALRTLPIRSFLDGVRMGVLDWHTNDFHCFSDKGDWGIYSDHDVGALLGGEPSFVAEFLERSGGFDAFKARTDKKARENLGPAWDVYYRAADWPLLDVDPAVREHWHEFADAVEEQRQQRMRQALSEE